MADADLAQRLKVFISYSRRDSSDFAEELVAGLELTGFAPFLDRHDIAAGEDWEARLGGLIQSVDTVVFVVSPEAVKSERCAWEVDNALAETKRLLPVIWKPVPESEIPEALRRRQFIRFDTGFGTARPLALLAEALRQDLDWIREHTRLSELAGRWDARGHPESVLLRGDDLAAAQSWAGRWRAGAPEITDQIRAFIDASKEAETAHLAKSKAAHRRVRWAQAFAAVCALAVVAALTGWLNQDWLKERVYALTNVHALTAARERALKPKDSFKECTDCPEMVVVPAGSFMMGSPSTEKNRSSNEGPLHSVTIGKPFAVAKFELMFAEWDACVDHGDCVPHVPDSGWGRGRQPAINVSWDDAQRYVAWLSRVTGKHYRLFTEAEYEYAARAGTQTAYPWGDDIKLNGEVMANCNGCGSKWDAKRTAPVGSFPANTFGLYDMVGNVFEWTEDCYHPNYQGAPASGSAWIAGGTCTDRILRGGAWYGDPRLLRSADRLWVSSVGRDNFAGFRVGRTLTP